MKNENKSMIKLFDINRKWLLRYLPPGAELSQEIYGFLGMLGIIFLGNISFLGRYGEALGSLYTYQGHSRILIRGAKIAGFDSLMSHSLGGLRILVIYCILISIVHYMSFSRGSKSIYLMKRLPQRGEMTKRCVLLPLMEIAAGIVFCLLLLLLNLGIYYLITPKICLPSEFQLSIWRVL